MPERLVRGVPASPGIAAGRARVLDPALPAGADAAVLPEAERPAEASRAQAALDAAQAEIERVAERLRAEGRGEEAEIVDTGALLAADPALRESVRAAVGERGATAAAAILEASGEAADTLAALEDPMLAARADDLRSVGRRAARLAIGDQSEPDRASAEGVVVIATDLGPADVAELGAEVSAIALGAGAVTAHAAIVARSLGVPMAIGLGGELASVEQGQPIVVDGSEGSAILDPSAERLKQALAAGAARADERERAAAERSLPAVTLDGTPIAVLANVASPAEVRVALEAGAEGVGLLRTELAFLDAPGWPSEDQHQRALRPTLEAIGDRLATVRVLDFGGDKSPPFLTGASERGIALLLADREALETQLRAILRVGHEARLRVLLPLVAGPDQVRAAREALTRSSEAAGRQAPPLGAMIETVEAVERVGEIAAAADFLSIGTNDLAASVLGRDRFAPGSVTAHDPRVLGAIAATARAGAEAGLLVEVCGEAASEPLVAPILIGLGVGELSVGAARVGATRRLVREARASDARELAAQAVEATDADAVEALVGEAMPESASGEGGDAADQGPEGAGSVLPLRREP
jgi:phosphoenolpyruvate-protein kinase (PTS system EI component)